MRNSDGRHVLTETSPNPGESDTLTINGAHATSRLGTWTYSPGSDLWVCDQLPVTIHFGDATHFDGVVTDKNSGQPIPHLGTST